MRSQDYLNRNPLDIVDVILTDLRTLHKLRKPQDDRSYIAILREVHTRYKRASAQDKNITQTHWLSAVAVYNKDALRIVKVLRLL